MVSSSLKRGTFKKVCMMQTVRYPYGEDFQFKILAVMVQDPVFLSVHHDAINPHYFERVHLTTVCQLVLNHFVYYRQIPDYASISAAVEDHVVRCHAPDEVADFIRQTAWWIYNNPVSDIDYVKDRVLRFGQRQALKGAVNDIIDKLEKDEDYDDCREIVEKALQVGLAKSGGMDFGAALPILPDLASHSETYSRRIPTMLSALDRCLQRGLGVGEIGVVVAPPGVGKTTTLTNFGYGAICHNFNVLHVTLEAKEIDIALKYAARHTATSIDLITANDSEFLRRAENSPISANRLMIKYFSPGTATTANIRALLSFLHGQGFNPDLLIVDYLKKVKYSGDIVGGLGRVVDELITLGDDFHCGVWTAQQAQRNYRFAERTSVSGIANDISVLENADVVLALSQNEREHRDNRYRIETGKIRRGDDAFVIACWCQYAYSTICEMTEGEVNALYRGDTSGGQNS